MTVTRGKVHKFVGMDIRFKDNKTVEIIMVNYITECFEAFGEPLKKGESTPAKHNLFEVINLEKVSEEKKDLFHDIVAKLLFVSKRARVDIDLAISFLCTSLSCSTSQDWENFRRLLHDLYGTLDMPRIIGANGMEVLQTWVDASYAIHQDMRGHTGGVV